tara:strand:+ start:706 stop:2427 length:1722 start_codon:yes stop_codon:yes gene_type:complete
MKLFIKKIYIIFFLLTIFFAESKVFARENNTQYSKKDISNYFSGIISISKEYNNDKAFKYLDDVQSIHSIHSQYNIEYLRTLVLLEKFRRAFAFSKKVWSEDELFFEADLLLGLNFFIKKDYKNAEKYFKRLNKISHYNLIFDNFVGNILLAWTKASQGHEAESYQYIKKIPNLYNHLKETQNIFLQCYFDNSETQKSLEKLIGNKDYNFSRYNFFLINYLLSQNKTMEAKEVIKNSRKKHNSNLLIKQTEYFFLSGENEKIINFFNCKNPKDSLAEFFYVIANLYSSEQDYRLSNFYLQISFFLNNNFLSNKALLAENFYFQNKKKEAKKVYKSIKTIGSVYSWHSSKNIATILQDEEGIKYSINSIQKDFNLLLNTNFEHYYELANFYKENDYYEESIKYYSLALKKIKKDHALVPKIFDRRGTSYERLGDWENAEKDLLESLKILPDQPHVLNYLAYTWVDRGINLDRGLEMLKKATELKKDDGYIIDSLGWAYYAKKNYIKAKFFLERAVELLPTDPIINDHYADALWMLNKKIQARYIWKSVLKLNSTEQKLKDSIKKKLIFGIVRQS